MKIEILTADLCGDCGCCKGTCKGEDCKGCVSVGPNGCCRQIVKRYMERRATAEWQAARLIAPDIDHVSQDMDPATQEAWDDYVAQEWPGANPVVLAGFKSWFEAGYHARNDRLLLALDRLLSASEHHGGTSAYYQELNGAIAQAKQALGRKP